MLLVPVRSQGRWDSIYVTNSMEERRRDGGLYTRAGLTGEREKDALDFSVPVLKMGGTCTSLPGG